MSIEENMSSQAYTLPLTEATISVNGDELFYRMGGQGPPLLLIHGFTFTGHWWAPFLDVLGEHYTVILPDLPGHGGSSLGGTFSFYQAARGVFAILDKLGIDGIQGIGHSAGANTLIHMAIQQPARVEAMVLMGGAHRMTVEAREALRAFSLEIMEPAVQAYYWRHHPGGEPQIRSIMAQLRGLADNYEDYDFSPEHLATIPTRTLLVWGDRDPLVSVELAFEMYRAMPDVALWVIPNQEHTPVWTTYGGSPEAASIFCPVVLQFLEQGQSDDGP